eukprot:TRINITY_DN10795_c0_g1_i1.p1 TRINITY_DN10795_c0_g1~~TRINITY_DN10795_c0_g1_i1.p1  ORF type:complete len:530 (+),score=108.79 TRINITY_DN10795_c0_g1_i1:70-1590(+)
MAAVADEEPLRLEQAANEVLVAIRERLNKTQTRTIDLFRKVDASGDGTLSASEFRAGLSTWGFQMTEVQSQAVAVKLDKDGSGDVTLKELDRALKQAKGGDKSARSLAVQRIKTAQAKSSSDSTAEAAEPPAIAEPNVLDGIREHRGYHSAREQRLAPLRRKPTLLAPMTEADEVMARIKGMLNRRKVRAIDVFQFLDSSGNGEISRAELLSGLARLGSKVSEEDVQVLLDHLDTDGSGEISINEFFQALKLAEKKARAEGKTKLIDTWVVPPELALDFDQEGPYNWSARTMKFDSQLRASMAFPEQQQSLSFAQTTTAAGGGLEAADPVFELSSSSWKPSTASIAPEQRTWSQCSRGPWHHAVSQPLGCGNIQDNSIFRQRLMDNTWASRPPSSNMKMQQLPLYKHGTFKQMIGDTRWGAAPTDVPDQAMHWRKMDRCVTAKRPRHRAEMAGGIKKFPNTPMMQSEVDSVIFGRDLDQSGDSKFDVEFTAMFDGAYGLPSWHVGR